jgi:hypothetical protein
MATNSTLAFPRAQVMRESFAPAATDRNEALAKSTD